jgi:hypothetical protein
MNKRLLISESHDNTIRCTPYRRKPDTHDMYASDGQSTYVATFRKPSTALDGPYSSWEKKGSRHHSLPDWVICRSATQFLFQDNHWSSNESQASINNRLHRFTGPITFNTCSRGPAHQSLSNTGGGYNLKGVGLPHTTPRPFQPTVSTFHLSAPPGLRLSIINISL